MAISTIKNISWKDLKLAPPDAIYGLTEAFLRDTTPQKINLGAGTYRDNNNQPFVLRPVKHAEELINSDKMNKEYSTIAGDPVFVHHAIKLAYGTHIFENPNLAFSALQSVSGTGALALTSKFLHDHYPFPSLNDTEAQSPKKQIYVPNPTWANHKPIFAQADLESVGYPYYDPATCGLNFKGMVDSLRSIQDGSLVLLHVCAHNPTGVDLTNDQWNELADLFQEKQHFPLFDMAYQGFASGDFDRDAYAVRYFLGKNIPIALCQSFSKNMGLYGERVGTASFAQIAPTAAVDDSSSFLKAIKADYAKIDSQLKVIARRMYSSPPINGARIAKIILTDEKLYADWYEDVKLMSGRILEMRTALKAELEKAGSVRNWDHITQQIGMFCYTGMTKDQVDKLQSEYAIYLTQDGRISISGINTANVHYLASAIHAVTK